MTGLARPLLDRSERALERETRAQAGAHAQVLPLVTAPSRTVFDYGVLSLIAVVQLSWLAALGYFLLRVLA